MRSCKTMLTLALAVCLLAGAIPARALDPTYTPTTDYQATPWYDALLDVTLTGNHAADLLQVALSQLGYHEGNAFHTDGTELDGNRNWTEYGYWYGMNAQPWCAMFVSWCARQGGLGQMMNMSAFASTTAFGVTWKDPGATPKPGDLVFFYYENGTGWAHVAMVLHVTEDSIYTLEGNISNCVRIRCLPRDWERIRCYGSWTEETCDLDQLGITGLYAFSFLPNGGTGEMASVCTYNDTPVRFFPNKITYDEAGHAMYSTWMHREGYTFAGWYLQRTSDGAWLTGQGFLSGQVIGETQTPRTILADGASFSVDPSWATDPLERFRCYAVWKDSTGKICNADAYLPEADSTGWPNPYRDVAESAWYYDALRDLTRRGIFSGSDGFFHPNQSLTRGVLVTLLYKTQGQPEVTTAGTFTDVPTGRYDAAAVEWAAAQGIMGGYGNGRFGPDDPVTREQLAVVLQRFARSCGYDIPSRYTDLASFTDGGSVSTSAVEAVEWASSLGLLTGSGNVLNPRGVATRAQCAAVLEKLQTLSGDRWGTADSAPPLADDGTFSPTFTKIVKIFLQK